MPRKNFDYHSYFTTKHWLNLKRRLIVNNYHKKCYVCGKTSKLLIHHLNYKRLWHERVFYYFGIGIVGDVVIVCFDCHERMHKPIFRRLLNKKYKNSYVYLVRRLFFLKCINCVQRGEFVSFAWHFLGLLLI